MDEQITTGDIVNLVILLPTLVVGVIAAHVIGAAMVGKWHLWRKTESNHWAHDYSIMIAEGCSLRLAILAFALSCGVFGIWILVASFA